MRRIWLALIVSSLGWGTAGVATRAVLDQGVGPYAVAALRSVIAAVVVIVFLAVRKSGLPRSPEAWKVGLAMGISNLAVPYILYTIALQYASAGFLGITTALIPLFTALLAHLFLVEERLTTMKFGGLVLGFVGVAALLGSGDSGLAEGGRPVMAGLLSLGAVAAISIGGIYAKHHAAAYQPLEVTGVHFVSGSIMILFAMLIFEGAPAGPSGKAWLLLTFMGVLTTFLPFFLYYWMLRWVSATFTAIAGYLVPPIAVVAGIVFLSERLQPGMVLGGLLIFGGVLITDRAERVSRRPLDAFR